ncbi:TonB-dependent siderophore receptor [Commensalibacter communis]|uniref:TonB-dependent siderophore receptor n=1 Tax=Commensalibacter communis TaxID=2972786 RepID=UPI0022FFA531|nr:TonB-dependent siderophore receptor [Commensalibacter communis]CAI3956975.1 Fe transport (CirA) (PDB:1BY3) [Commensalibacter communis]CAI3957702.1 Fe transport (CirA) (PDB:1BY3) [Commensalibacter communis]
MGFKQRIIVSLVYAINIAYFLDGYQSFAQEKDSDPVTETIVVRGERVNGPVHGYVAKQSSTASKTETSILKIPQSISVVGREEMDDRNVQTTTQALQYVPGVFASTSAASQRFDYFNIRGFDATLNGALLDGLRSTTAQSYARYQPFGMERIEVLRGPSGFLYGIGSPGGVVNAISKQPTKEKIREVGVNGGSYGRIQGEADFSGPIDKDKTLLYRVVGVIRKSGTQFRYVPDNTGYIAPSFSWKPDSNTSLTILSSFSRDEFGPPRPFLPIYGTILSNPNGKLKRNLYLDGRHLDNHMTQMGLGYIFDHRFDDTWSIHSASRYTYNDLLTQTLSGMSLASDMRTLNRAAYEFRITGRVFSMDNYGKAEWGIGDIVKATSILGTSWRNLGEDYSLDFGRASSIDIYHPTYGAGFSAPTPFTQTYQKANEVGVYTAHTLTFVKHLVLNFDARQDWAMVDTRNKLSRATTSQNDNKFTYLTGLTYVTDFGAAPYFSYTTSFAPTLGTDFYGNTFKPTEGKQIEAGIKYKPNHFDALFTFAWFRIDQTNVKTTDPNNIQNSIQTGEVRSQGVELSAVANITSDFKVLANYTYNDLSTTKTTVPGALHKVPTGLPQHMASFWGDYTLSKGKLAGLGLGFGMRYVGKTYANTLNTIKVPDFTLFDMAAHYNFKKLISNNGLRLDVNLNNMFNKSYYSTCSASSCNEGFGRTVMANLTYRW